MRLHSQELVLHGFTHVSLACGGIDAFGLAEARQGGKTVLALDKNPQQVKTAVCFWQNLGRAQAKDTIMPRSIGQIQHDPDMFTKVKGVDIWTFTPPCGAWGTARQSA